MENSKISWTDDTANPIIVEGGGFYCVKISPGCKFCYAEVVNKRICGYQHTTPHDYKLEDPTPTLVLKEDMLANWAKKKRPRKIFVSSMTDIFGEFVPEEFMFKILDAMIAAPQHVFQVLTKRASIMRKFVNKYVLMRGLSVLPAHIWLIVSVETMIQEHRIFELVMTNCSVRGLSLEPLLDFIDLTKQQALFTHEEKLCVASRYIEAMDWVIVGGESGHNARPVNPLAVYDLKRQCDEYDVPFFFKQWGEWVGVKWDRNKDKAICEDDSIFWTNPGHPPVHQWDMDWPGDDSYFRVASARTGKHPRILYAMAAPRERLSNNALLGGKEYMAFPKCYLV